MPGPEQTPATTALVLVSHSAEIARGTASLAAAVGGDEVRIHAVGGLADGSLGTDARRVEHALRAAAATSAVVLADVGGSVLAVRAALAALTPTERERLMLVDAPLVEGALAAAATASTGALPAAVAAAAEDAARISKL